MSNLKQIKILNNLLDEKEKEVKLRERYINGVVEIQKILLMNGPFALSKTLQKLGEITGEERIYLFKNAKYDNDIVAKPECFWTDSNKTDDNEIIEGIPFSENPDLFNALVNEKILHIRTEYTPEKLKAYLEKHKVKILLWLPIFIKDLFYGFIGFSNCQSTRKWQSCEIDFLKTIANSLSLYIRNKLNEKSLLDSERIYKALFDTTGSATVIDIDSEIIIKANNEFLSLTGYSKEELENKKHWNDIIFETDKLKFQKYTEYKTTDTLSLSDCRIVNKEGRTINTSVIITSVSGTNKRIASFINPTRILSWKR